MYRLYKFSHQASVRVSQPASFDRLARQHRKNLIAVLKHCRGASYSVGNRHPLVRMLRALDLDSTLPLLEYHRVLQQRLEGVRRRFKLITPQTRGTMHEGGAFYGPNVTEGWLSMEGDVDILNLERTWRSLKPVTVFRHSQTDLSLNLPLGQQTETTGMALIGIDLEALGLQYWGWMREQRQLERSYLRTIQHFIHEYPLPNMLVSHLEVAWCNRFRAILNGQVVAKTKNRWPIPLLTVDSDTDKYLFDRSTYLARRASTYQEYYTNLQLPVSENAWEFTQLPYGLLTRQNRWGWILTTMDHLKILIQLDRFTGSSRNYHEESNLRKEFRELRHDQSIAYALPPGESMDVDLEIRDQILRYL